MNTEAATPTQAPAGINMGDSIASPANTIDTALAVVPVDSGTGESEYDISLDELIGADFGDDPIMQGTHKGIPDYKKILEHIPENGRKLVQNLRASYTQKTTEIAELRRQLESERAEILRERELLSNSEFAKQVKATADAPLQHDAWSDEGLQERINKQAAEQMARLLAPLQQDLEAQRRQVALESFKSQHPDLTSDEMRVPIAKMLMERPELRLEDAYHIVRSQVVSSQQSIARQAQKDVLLKTSTGNAVRNAQPPKFKDAWQAFQWHKANGTK